MAIRLCFIGVGAVARYHARILKQAGAELHTAVGRVPETTGNFANEMGFIYSSTDLETALAMPDIDAVVISSPSQMHYQHTLQALQAGKHVLVEVPLATNLHEANELVELAKERDLYLMVAQSHRFFPQLIDIKNRVSNGELYIHHLIGRSVFLRRENTGWTGRQRSWTDSVLWHHGCHLVDFSLWLFDTDQVEVTAQMTKPDLQTGIPMELDILLRTPRDQLVSLSLSFNSHIHQYEEYLVIGEEDTIRFEEGKLFNSSGICDDHGARGENYYELAWTCQDREFLNGIIEGYYPRPSGADTLPTISVLQKIEDMFMTDG